MGGIVSAIFGGPKVPSASPVPPPAPTVDNSQAQLDAAARQQAAAMQRGRSSTMLTGGAGLNDMGSTSKTLLGS